MPTARELLEQADALMRRNRGRDTNIPVLTDVVAEEPVIPPRGGPSTRERMESVTRDQVAEARAPHERAERESAPIQDRQGEAAPSEDGGHAPEAPTASPAGAIETQPGADESERDPDLPILTDAVEEVALEAVLPPPEAEEGDVSLWLGPDTIDPALHSVTGPAPDTLGIVPPLTIRAAEPQAEAALRADTPDSTVSRTLRAAGSAPTPPPSGSTPPGLTEEAASAREPAIVEATNDEERWRALAEQISMQVLQRLDLFIDTGLKTRLASHLQPIVARAGAELVEAINDHVGQLVRTYVAEAIEREIAQWRKQHE